MFLVLIVHADFWSLGAPTAQNFVITPLNAWTRTFIEFVSIVCVNVFILISGWFGIKPSMKGFGNFLFQCLYFLCGLYILFLIMGRETFSFIGLQGCFGLTHLNWFIKAYVGLYIFSPLLNTFLRKSSKHQIEIFIISFYGFQTIYGWTGAARFFEQGYSTISFCGLYILASYIRSYIYRKNVTIILWGLIFFICIMMNSLAFWITQKNNISLPIDSYINPLTILASISLLLFFNGVSMKSNKIINWIAKSSFAVFLLHTNPNVLPIYKDINVYIYDNHTGINCLLTLGLFSIFIYVLAILLDQPRRWFWSKISLFKGGQHEST